MPATYPPEKHLLRDLRLRFEHRDDLTSDAWMPIVPGVCTDDGAVRAGALATLVDTIGGGLAAIAAQPDWIATADLTLHMSRALTTGSVGAHARVLRAGRTTVVIEVDLVDDHEAPVGIATMSFSVLPRRDMNPDITAVRNEGASTMAYPDSTLAGRYGDILGISVVDAADGVVEVPVSDWGRNSLGALQGGAVALVIDTAAEAALRAATGEPLVITDLHVTYLSLNRVGPIRSTTTVLDATPSRAVARVELVDTGSEARRTTIASVVASRPLPRAGTAA